MEKIDKIYVSSAPSNTGAENTRKVKKTPFSSLNIDYFTCTLKKHNLSEVLEWFGTCEKSAILREKGLYGYRKCYVVHTKILVYFDHEHNQDILLWLSGKACREMYYYHDWVEFFKFITKYDLTDDSSGEITNCYNVSRIDLANDYYNWKFDVINRVRKCCEKKLLSSKFYHRIIFDKRKNDDNACLGNSVRFGSMGSRISIIFYDKLLEREHANYDVSPDIKSWYRMETNYRDEHANAVFQELLNNFDNISNYHSSVVYNYLDFKDLGDDVNKSRWKTSMWWSEMLETSKKQKITPFCINSTIMEKRDWIDNQVAKSLLLVSYAYGVDSISNLLLKGYDSLEVSDLNMLREYYKLSLDDSNHEYMSRKEFSDLKEDIKKYLDYIKRLGV